MNNDISKLESILDGYKEAQSILEKAWDKMDELTLHPIYNANEYVQGICDGFEDIVNNVCFALDMCCDVVYRLENEIEALKED